MKIYCIILLLKSGVHNNKPTRIAVLEHRYFTFSLIVVKSALITIKIVILFGEKFFLKISLVEQKFKIF